MKKNRIRPLAICVFRNRGRILVAEGYDPLKKQTFYRPLGGGIEFGESGTETVCRELKEEGPLYSGNGKGPVIEGSIYGPYRKAMVSIQGDYILSAVERRGYNGFCVSEKTD